MLLHSNHFHACEGMAVVNLQCDYFPASLIQGSLSQSIGEAHVVCFMIALNAMVLTLRDPRLCMHAGIETHIYCSPKVCLEPSPSFKGRRYISLGDMLLKSQVDMEGGSRRKLRSIL